jgi:hypothetical protein
MRYIAVGDFEATKPEYLELKEGDSYIVIDINYGKGWAYGCTLDGSITGVFPSTYVQKVKNLDLDNYSKHSETEEDE